MFRDSWLSEKCYNDFFETTIDAKYTAHMLETFSTFKDNRDVLNNFYKLCLKAKDINSKGD